VYYLIDNCNKLCNKAIHYLKASYKEGKKYYIMNKIRNIFAALIIFMMSCATFMLEEQERELMSLDGKTATMKKEMERDSIRLDKGQKVRLHIITKDDSIRVYAYSADVDFLKSRRLLILHLFDDDFKDNRFEKKLFMDKLNDVVILESK